MATADISPLDSAPAFPGYRLEGAADVIPGLGSVYRARRLARDAPVLLTVMAPGGRNAGRLRERFGRWTALRSGLEHVALAPMVDAGYFGDQPFVAVARPAGVGVPDLLAEGRLAPARALAILDPVADLLDRLPARRLTAGVVPARTISVGVDDRPVLTELGLVELSLQVHGQGDMPRDAVYYAAPELLRGLRPTAPSEVYALAALAFELLTGGALWNVPDAGLDGQGGLRAVMARRASPAPVDGARRLGLGPRVVAVLRRALAEEAGLRPESPLELMFELRQALEQQSGASRRRAQESTPGTRAHRHPPVAPPTLPATTPRRPSHATTPGALPSTAAGAERERTPIRSEELSRRPPSVGVRRTAVPAFAAAVVVGSVLAVAAEPGVPRAATAPPATLLTASKALGIAYPSTWRPLRGPSELAGLPLRDGIALEPGDEVAYEPRVRLLAGMVDSTDARLLPPDLDRRLRTDPVQEEVRLADHAAYRYRELRWRGESARVTLYVVPTTRGVATVACLAAEWDRARAAECEAIATTLRVVDGGALPLGPSRAFGARLDRVFGRLDSARRVERARLGQARSAPGQARRALDLALVYEVAHRDLMRGRPPAGVAATRAGLGRRLRAVAAVYREIAATAGRRDRTAFNRARASLAARDAAVDSALARLRSLGYRRA